MTLMMKRFGAPWGKHELFADEPEPVPIGQTCFLCKLPMREKDRGLLVPHLGKDDVAWRHQPWHISCLRDCLGQQ